MARKARPLALPHDCDDRRYPRLVDGYVVYCGADGVIDRALDLRTGDIVPYEPPAPGPWATHGGELAWTSDGTVHRQRDGREYLYPSRPAPWYFPAVGASWLVWTEVLDGDARIVGVPPGEADPIVLADGPGPQHHPVASGDAIAWVDAGDVVVARPDLGTAKRYDADAGFESGPTLYGEHACWGTRDLRVVCSDGFEVAGRRPSGGGPLLLVQTEHGAVLYAAEAWDGIAVDDPIPPGLR